VAGEEPGAARTTPRRPRFFRGATKAGSVKSKALPEIAIRAAANEDTARVKALVFGVLAEYGWQPGQRSTDSDLDDIEGNYLRPGGLFELIEDKQGNLLGTVGLYPLDRQVCELRKMYFISGVRGRGLGRRVLERMIESARRLGFKRIELETASVLKAAAHLYVSYGFKPMERDGLAPRCDQAFYLDL
jgi:putative acetyltransferase